MIVEKNNTFTRRLKTLTFTATAVQLLGLQTDLEVIFFGRNLLVYVFKLKKDLLKDLKGVFYFIGVPQFQGKETH